VQLYLVQSSFEVTYCTLSDHFSYRHQTLGDPRFGVASAMLMQILVFWDSESVKIDWNQTFSEKRAALLCYVSNATERPMYLYRLQVLAIPI